MDKLKKTLLEGLQGLGIPAQAGNPWTQAGPLRSGVVNLTILGAASEGGCQYLGLDEQQRECYGTVLTVEFAMVLLSPKEQGASGAEAMAQQVLERLIAGVGGLALGQITLEKAEYDGVRDCYSQLLKAKTRVLAWGGADEPFPLLREFRLEAGGCCALQQPQ